MNTVTVTVCWACKKGGEEGPLVKVGKVDYVHVKCGGRAPDIQNQSFKTENRLQPKDIKEMMNKLKEANDKTK